MTNFTFNSCTNLVEIRIPKKFLETNRKFLLNPNLNQKLTKNFFRILISTKMFKLNLKYDHGFLFVIKYTVNWLYVQFDEHLLNPSHI